MPRPSSAAVSRNPVGRIARFPVPAAAPAGAAWSEDDPAPRRWSRSEAEALARAEPPLSPWKVVAAQVVVAVACGAIAWLVAGLPAAGSALWGGAVVAVPGAVMARAATSRLATISPLAGTVSLLTWGFVKIALAFLMLAMAQRVVPGLVWPAMLATLFVCLQTYWLALLVRGRPQ